MSKTVPAFIERDFTDAGTGQSFKAGKVEEIGEGAFGNYEPSGLVREPTEAELKAAEKSEAPDAPPADTNTAPAKPAKATAKA